VTAEGDLQVWYVPQLPMPAFKVSAPDLPTAVLLLDTLGRFSLFEYENRVKPDYADMGGISRWESDGEGGFEWCDLDNYDIEEALSERADVG